MPQLEITPNKEDCKYCIHFEAPDTCAAGAKFMTSRCSQTFSNKFINKTLFGEKEQ